MKVSSDMEDKVFKIDYGNEIESEISKLISQINDTQSVKTVFPHRWLAIKLLESDEEVHLRLMVLQGGAELIKSSRASIEKLEGILGDDVDIFMADRRYAGLMGS